MVDFARTVACVIAASGLVSTANAADGDLPIRYEAHGAGCPTPEAFDADVSQRLAGARTVGMRYVARVAEADGAWEGTLTATDEDGRTHERSLRGTTCSETAHALAFMTALAIGLGGWPDVPPRVPKVAIPVVAPPVAHVARHAPLPATPAWGGEVAAGVTARGGLAPTMSLGGELRFGVASNAPSAFAPAIDLALDVAASGTLTVPAGRADFMAYIGRIDFCPLVWAPTRHVTLRPCGSVELGAVASRAESNAHVVRDLQGWVAFGVDAVARFAVSDPFFVDLTAGALFPASRTTYEFGPSAPVFTVPAVTGRLVVALGLRLW